ncbi:Diacylglycerol O-acyltransferase [Moraxella cuniculi]|uniref:diacylglycerol O-acyltransferase n=2 Tax=Moraxella cuniculi TaxID=34061 RepID=A0A3S4SDS3_9GAMM|nr:Diacylglycerol O-acyltransferase [Moraxella cuniculi]
MRMLGIVDLLFLLLENAKQPMHVAGICVFELPKHSTSQDEARYFAQLLGQADVDNLPNFPFNQQLAGIFWQKTSRFDWHKHCYHHRLQTGEMSELLEKVSNLHEERLSKDRPLWQLHLFSNLQPEHENAPKRFALYLKIHHAVLDGVAAMRLFQRLLSGRADEVLPQPLWSRQIRQRQSSFVRQNKSFLKHLTEQLGSITPVLAELKQDYKLYRQGQTEAFIGSLQAPPSLFNQKITTRRDFLAIALQKSRFVEIAKTLGLTTNDVILAVCAYALRAYLCQQNALPSKSLIAFVPISLRNNDTALGNQISFIPTNLGTADEDLLVRINKISQSIQAGKARMQRMTQAQFINYTAAHYAWAGVNLALRLYPKKQAFNLVISNIPGDDNTPLYLNGARLSAVYPASVLFDGQALNISFANYQDRIDFGLIACGEVLPNIHHLPELIKQGLGAYENLLFYNKTPIKD